MSLLLLDALFPPAPDDLVADCRSVGAAGCWVYVWRPGGIGSWTPARVQALHAAGLLAPAIVVPGDQPGPPGPMVAAAAAMGCDPVVAADFEATTEPPASWEDQFDQAAAAAGWRELNYGTSAVLGQYDPGEPGWQAEWVRTGVLDPLPALAAGQLVWQFVNDVRLAHGVYDASVVDPALFDGVAMPLDPNDPVVKDIVSRLGAIQYAIGAPVAEGELLARERSIDQHTGADAPAALAAVKTELDAIQAHLNSGAPVSDDVVLGHVEAALKAAGSALQGA